MSILQAQGLHKSYRQGKTTTHAVQGVSLTLNSGEILAFLGPNGAGKTTTIEILEGFRPRTSGDVTVLGEDPDTAPLAWRERIGIVLQESEPVPELTALEAVTMQSAYYSNARNPAEVLDIVGLTDSANQRTRKLSGGQKRRLDLALALIGNPALVFLDEPTTGFDPAARRRSWELVRGLTADGTTVVLTTHYLEEAEELADRLIVMAGGQIVASGTPDELRAQAGSETIIRFGLPLVDAPLNSLLDPLHGSASGRDRRIEISTARPTADLAHVTNWAVGHGIELNGLTVESVTLEDVYLRLVGEDA